MPKLLLLPGSFEADYCLPWGTESGPAPTPCLVQDNNLASYGITLGMVIVARGLLPRETPPGDSFCIIRIDGSKYLKRVNFGADKNLYLSDDVGEEVFDPGRVYFEAVALHACACELSGAHCVPITLSAEVVKVLKRA